MRDIREKPDGYKDYLGEFGPQFYDGYCGEPISWGFTVTKYLAEDKFKRLREFGFLECGGEKWHLIVKKLNQLEAIEKYGEVIEIIVGTRGGFKSVVYGDKRFSSHSLSPMSRMYDDLIGYFDWNGMIRFDKDNPIFKIEI